jgi:hypothetical protein
MGRLQKWADNEVWQVNRQFVKWRDFQSLLPVVAGVSSCHHTGCRQEETPNGTEYNFR